MLNEFSTLKVKGASFTKLTELKLFEPRDGKDKNGNAFHLGRHKVLPKPRAQRTVAQHRGKK